MTQDWTSPVASLYQPNDDVCAQFTATAPCTLQNTPSEGAVTVYEVNGQMANVVVDTEDGGEPVSATFPFNDFVGNYYTTSTKHAD